MKILKAWEEATALIQSNPDEALALVSQFTFKSNPDHHFTIEELKKMVGQDPLQDVESNLKVLRFSSGSESVYSGLQYIARFFQRKNITKGYIDPIPMMDARFIRALHAQPEPK